MRILLNRVSGLGDVLILTSVIKVLRQQGHTVALRTNHLELVLGNKDIRRVIPVQIPLQRCIQTGDYEKVVDFDFCVESSLVHPGRGQASERDYMNVPRIDLFFKWAGLDPNCYSGLVYRVTDGERKWARKVLRKFKGNGRPSIVWVLNSTSPYRTYPVRYSIQVIRELVKEWNVIVVGTVKEIWGLSHPFTVQYLHEIQDLDPNHFLDYTGKTSVRELIALVAVSDLVVTPDTSAVHISNAVETPCVALFGNIHPELRCNRYPNVHPVFSCPPCLCGDRYEVIKEQCMSWEEIESPTIRRIGARCMEMILPEEVIKVVQKILFRR